MMVQTCSSAQGAKCVQSIQYVITRRMQMIAVPVPLEYYATNSPCVSPICQNPQLNQRQGGKKEKSSRQQFVRHHFPQKLQGVT